MSYNRAKPRNTKPVGVLVDPIYASLQTKQQKARYFLQKVNTKLLAELSQQKLVISYKKKPYLDQKFNQDKQQERERERLRELKKEREEVRDRLDRIEQQEKEVIVKKHKQIKSYRGRFGSHNGYRTLGEDVTTSRGKLDISTSINALQNQPQKNYNSETDGSRPRSEVKADDIALLRRLRQEQHQFQRKLKQRSIQYENRMKKMQQEKLQLQEKRKKQQSQLKRQLLQKRLKQLQERRQQKTRQYQQERHRIVQLRGRKKMYEQMETKFEVKSRQEQELRRKQFQERSKNRSVDLQGLREHEKRYDDTIDCQKAKRAQRLLEMNRANNNRRIIGKIAQSKYYTLVIEQEKRHKEQEAERQEEAKLRRKNLEEYANKVREQHALKVKSEENSQQQTHLSRHSGNEPRNRFQNDKKVERKTYQQIKDIGNSYLQKSKALMSKSNNTSEQLKIIQVHEVSSPLKRYKDYLEETRMKRKPLIEQGQQKGKNRQNRSWGAGEIYMRQVEEAKKIMRKEGCQKEKIDRVKMLTQKIQQEAGRIQGDGSKNMINKIAAKIKILEAIN